LLLLNDCPQFTEPTLWHFASQFGEFFFGRHARLSVNPVRELLQAVHGFATACKLYAVNHQTVIDRRSQEFVEKFPATPLIRSEGYPTRRTRRRGDKERRILSARKKKQGSLTRGRQKERMHPCQRIKWSRLKSEQKTVHKLAISGRSLRQGRRLLRSAQETESIPFPDLTRNKRATTCNRG
jgi:hypothetical protein